jgi:hypothetical protein
VTFGEIIMKKIRILSNKIRSFYLMVTV